MAVDCRDVIARYAVGDAFVVEAGAPGIGRTVYRVTGVDDRGLWGYVESNTMRMLDPEEVR